MLALVLLAFVVSTCAAHGAARGDWRTYKAAGFSIALPSSWRVVPQSDTQLRALIERLESRRKFDLALQYLAILNDPYQRGRAGGFSFQAFPWPADDYPITTDLVVRRMQVPPTLATDEKTLRRFAVGLADGLRPQVRKDGGTVSAVRPVRLPAGPAFTFNGSTPLDSTYGGAKSAFGIFVVGSGRTVYMIHFRADSRAYSARARTFSRIASTISFR